MEKHATPLAKELSHMALEDQDMRRKFSNGGANWDTGVDERHQERLKAIVAETGWPTISKVGAEAAHAAWLIVQHAPDLVFMERCLELMESAPDGDVSAKDVAYLKDRVLMMNGKPQVYGTQFQGTGRNTRVYPIADATHVDERRASVGLGSFAEYEAYFKGQHSEDA